MYLWLAKGERTALPSCNVGPDVAVCQCHVSLAEQGTLGEANVSVRDARMPILSNFDAVSAIMHTTAVHVELATHCCHAGEAPADALYTHNKFVENGPSNRLDTSPQALQCAPESRSHGG